MSTEEKSAFDTKTAERWTKVDAKLKDMKVKVAFEDMTPEK